jgi:two-component system LytT family response regulator/two-component system response regulator LytT
MSELQGILHPPNFFLSHRSFIINLDKIESIDIWFNGAYRVKMQGREELIPVSRGNAAEFRALMHMS